MGSSPSTLLVLEGPNGTRRIHTGNQTFLVTRMISPSDTREMSLIAQQSNQVAFSTPSRGRAQIFQTTNMNARSADRMMLLMEALVEFLEAVEGGARGSALVPQADLRTPTSVVASLPTCRFTGADDSKECYICLSNFEEDELIRRLPCHHEFHAHCIDKWLLDVHRTCPCCRVDICQALEPCEDQREKFAGSEPQANSGLTAHSAHGSGMNSALGDEAYEGGRAGTLPVDPLPSLPPAPPAHVAPRQGSQAQVASSDHFREFSVRGEPSVGNTVVASSEPSAYEGVHMNVIEEEATSIGNYGILQTIESPGSSLYRNNRLQIRSRRNSRTCIIS
uniref:RING-type domain-containing protein n=1 Tax=Hanusia phi TaxID=3032 RepID=A0A7S0NBN7_9CRYP